MITDAELAAASDTLTAARRKYLVAMVRRSPTYKAAPGQYSDLPDVLLALTEDEDIRTADAVVTKLKKLGGAVSELSSDGYSEVAEESRDGLSSFLLSYLYDVVGDAVSANDPYAVSPADSARARRRNCYECGE